MVPRDKHRGGNSIMRRGTTVVKRYNAYGRGSCLAEMAVLSRLADLPVAHVKSGTRPDALHLEYVDGVLATEVIEAGFASNVLRAMGETLREIQRVPTSRFGAAADWQVLVHGDFAPYNVIVSDDGTTIRAIVDWEAACLRHPLTDLAWCEFQFLRLFPRHSYATRHLFEGYGATVDRAALEAERHNYEEGLCIRGIGPAVWPTTPFQAVSFAGVQEGAAFVAALSRAAGAPFQVKPYDPPAEIWIDVASPGVKVMMNEPAAAVAASVFSASKTEVVKVLPPAARLAFLASHVRPLGIDDVLAIL